MKKYINRKGNGHLETVDVFNYNTKKEREECERCCNEYNLSDTYGYYYMSQRACNDWEDPCN